MPLHAFVCHQCYLVQLKDYETPDAIFQDYAYFSSYSQSWLEHADQYVKTMMREYPLGINSQVIEIASNDGYLLQYFKKEQVPVLGIEPARNVARVAIEKGIPSISEFFGEALATMLAAEGRRLTSYWETTYWHMYRISMTL